MMGVVGDDSPPIFQRKDNVRHLRLKKNKLFHRKQSFDHLDDEYEDYYVQSVQELYDNILKRREEEERSMMEKK